MSANKPILSLLFKGNAEIECLSEGIWSSHTISCRKISCGEPPKLRHSERDESENLFQDSVSLLENFVIRFLK